MLNTNIYSYIIDYQKYIGTSIKVGCATRSLYASSGPKAERVPNNNQKGGIWGGGELSALKCDFIHMTYFVI